MPLLDVKQLSVEVDGKTIIDDVELKLDPSEKYVLFGPNGSGKTSLVNAIMGLPEYRLKKGTIVFDGVDVTDKPIDERVKLGMGLAFQLPPEITGVKLRDMMRICLGLNHRQTLPGEALELADSFNLTGFLDRDINRGFSGGERKRAEILQMLLMKPKLLLLDEPDSGVDIESLKLVGEAVENYLNASGASALVITHHGQILEHVKAKRACVFMEKIIYCQSSPQEIIESIRARGYEFCLECQRRRKSG